MSTSLFYSTKNEQELCEIIASFLSSYHVWRLTIGLIIQNEEEKQQINEHLMELFNSGKSGEFVISCCKELNAVYDKAKDKGNYFICICLVTYSSYRCRECLLYSHGSCEKVGGNRRDKRSLFRNV